MNFYSVEEVAKILMVRPDGVVALCQSGWFGRKIGFTWLITDKEIKSYLDGKRLDPADLPKLYDADAAINDLGISRSRFYRLVASGDIKALRFGKRGGKPNLVFSEEQLQAARQAVVGIDGAGRRPVDIDQYIKERDGRFYIEGTLTEDPNGVERNYKSLTIARAKAREAYGQEPVYRKGFRLPYGEQEIVVLEDVTPIDGQARLKIDGVKTLWPVKHLIKYEDTLRLDMELVTVYKDELWPEGKGESDGTDQHTE